MKRLTGKQRQYLAAFLVDIDGGRNTWFDHIGTRGAMARRGLIEYVGGDGEAKVSIWRLTEAGIGEATVTDQ